MAGQRAWSLRAAAAAAGVAALALTGCGSGDGSGSPSTTSAAAALAGSWEADAGAILDETLATLGLPDGVACSGPVTTTFAPEGTFTRSGAITCASGPLSATGRIDTSGTWTAEGRTLTIIADAPRGTMEIAGSTVPTPDGFGTGVAGYRLDGDTLTVTFSNQSVGTVTQDYTRSG